MRVKGSGKEEEQSLEKLMKGIVEVRKLRNTDYFERVTPQYELILEYHENTLHLFLYTVREKNYYSFVSDEGEHQLENGLLALDIF